MKEPEQSKGIMKLTPYDALKENSVQMLAAAQENRWDDLAVLDLARRERLLGAIAGGYRVDHSDIEAINMILACDEQVRQLVKLRQQELSTLMSSLDNERKLVNAYGLS